jgi:ABC-type branched-subunit amino acid transport system substrate-binding protein
MEPQKLDSKSKTLLSQPQKFQFPIAATVAIALVLLLGGTTAGYLLWRNDVWRFEAKNSAEMAADSLESVSQTAVNAESISQGEKVLLVGGKNFAEKVAGATAFSQQNWDEAIAQYQLASEVDPNDPEAKIYFNNSIAKKAENPLTIAVVVPISASENAAKEVLRGVALYQDEFNDNPTIPGRFLEVAIVNEAEPANGPSLAQDLIQAGNVLGAIGHGVDAASREAIAEYEEAQMAVLSPISTRISTDSTGQSILQTLSLGENADEVLDRYLESVGQTLVSHAAANYSPASAVIFYNTDSPYSQALKDKISAALADNNGELVNAVEVTAPGFNPAEALQSAREEGATIGFLALSKNKVDTAIAIAQVNANQAQPLALMGGDELYNPTLLKEGDAAIDGLILAVPWRWQQGDRFASQAAKIWRGRVSWRTATAYDTTQALANALTQNPTRAAAAQLLQQGIPISGTATDFNLFDRIPLVKAVPGTNAGYRYQFEPL